MATATARRADPLPAYSLLVRRATWFILILHGALLVAMLPDYFADNDLGYHISLARQYAEHGTYFWDRLNYGPGGRPNLQGPLLHYAVAAVGLVLGGEGDDYVLAFSLLAVLQWGAAMFTALYFARRYGGDYAALVAVALLSGSIYSAAPFFAGVPSGWIFILTAWAVYFFLEDRYVFSALFTSAVVYAHLGGITCAPFGVLLAAALTRRWRGLLVTGGITAVLATPYIIHFLRSLEWYRGERGHVAGSAAWLIYILALPGLILLLRSPRKHAFLIAWALAPAAWLFQDPLRFTLQSTIAGAVIGAMFVIWSVQRISIPRGRLVAVTALVILATVFPLSIPSLPVEAAWAAGLGFPRELDWSEARVLADVIGKAGLRDRLLSSYYASLGCAVSIYAPQPQQGGHWGEVRPLVDPALKLSAGDKVYLLPFPPTDVTADYLADRNRIRIHGGSPQTSVVTLTTPGRIEDVAYIGAEILRTEALWLAENGENNAMRDVPSLFTRQGQANRRARMSAQRARAGRMQAAVLVYAYALEPVSPDLAEAARRGAHGFGSIANFIGDETAIDYVSDARFEVFRKNLRALADSARDLKNQPLGTPRVKESVDKLMSEFF